MINSCLFLLIIKVLHWSKLAEMYYNLSEYDIVADIFCDKLNSNETLLKAIELEARRDYVAASQHYADVINKTNNMNVKQIEEDFAYQSYYNCLMYMGLWEELESQVDKQIDGNYDGLWDDEWSFEHLVPHYIRTELRTILNSQMQNVRSTNTQVKYIENMEGWLRHPERGEYIKQNFAEELMMLQVTNNNYLEARVYSEKHFMRFLAEWSNLNVLSDKVRASKILNIRNVAEIHNYCDLLRSDNMNSSILFKLSERWQNSQIDLSDSLATWDSLIAYRQFINRAAYDAVNDVSSVSSDRRLVFCESLFDMQFGLVEAAIHQNNLSFAGKIIQQLKWSVDPDPSKRDKLSAYVGIGQSKLSLQNSRSKERASEVSLALALNSWEEISSTIETHKQVLRYHPELFHKALHHMADVADYVLELWPRHCNNNNAAQLIHSRTPFSKSPEAEIEKRLFEHSVEFLVRSIDLTVDDENGGPVDCHFDLGNAHYNLAMLYQQKIGNEKVAATEQDRVQFEMEIVRNVLRGMQMDSLEARINFPTILQLPHINNQDIAVIFKTEVSLLNKLI